MLVRYRGLLSAILVGTHAATAFVAPGRNPSSSSSARNLQPDGFMGGDNRFGSYNDPGYRGYDRNQNNINDVNINPDQTGGALARPGAEGFSEGYAEDGTPLNADPMIRMDASAPRRGPGMGQQRSTVQGAGSRATWVSPDPHGYDEMNVHLGTAGRPLYANVEHWSGPNNTPSRMQLYSEDGGYQPWITKFKTPTNVPSGVTEVRNVGPMEFPIEASVSATNAPPQGRGYEQGDGGDPAAGPPLGSRMTKKQTIDGGALKTYGFDASVNEVYLEISSEGLPVNARVELWQGPSNTKAIANIYTDHGRNRPWSALIPLPGYGASICVLNEGPMEYPIEVRMDPPPKSAF